MTQNENSTPASTSTGEGEPKSRTGLQPSEHGAVTSASLPLKEALGRMDSDQVRREVRALCDQRWPFLQRIVDGNYDLTGFQVQKRFTETEREEIRSVARVLTKPADRRMVTIELTRCLSLTKSRSKGEEDMTAMISAMVDELSPFPEDLIVTSLREWSRKETFWPSLAEILEPIRREMKWRYSLIDAGNFHFRGDGPYLSRPGPLESSWKNLPQERKDQINEALRAIGITEPME